MSTTDLHGNVHARDGRFAGHIAGEPAVALDDGRRETSFEDMTVAEDDWSYLPAAGDNERVFCDAVQEVAGTIGMHQVEPSAPHIHVRLRDCDGRFDVGSSRIDRHGNRWVTTRDVSVDSLTDDPGATGNDAARAIARRLQVHFEQSVRSQEDPS